MAEEDNHEFYSFITLNFEYKMRKVVGKSFSDWESGTVMWSLCLGDKPYRKTTTVTYFTSLPLRSC